MATVTWVTFNHAIRDDLLALEHIVIEIKWNTREGKSGIQERGDKLPTGLQSMQNLLSQHETVMNKMYTFITPH